MRDLWDLRSIAFEHWISCSFVDRPVLLFRLHLFSTRSRWVCSNEYMTSLACLG